MPTVPVPSGSPSLRAVDLTRTGPGTFVVRNARGGELVIGDDDADFSPVELLLAALASCAAVNVEEITGRRATPARFAVRSEGSKVRDEQGGRLEDLRLLFDVVFPEGEDGDAARAVLPRTLAQTHDRICTVSRTVTLGTDVAYQLTDVSQEDGR